MFNKFQTKLVIMFAALFVLVQAMTYSSVYFATKSNIDSQVSEQLKYGGAVFQQTLQVNSDRWLNETRIFSTDYGFRSAVTTYDEATVSSALKNLASRVGASLALVMSLDGEMITQVSDDPDISFKSGEFNRMMGVADEYGDATAYIEINDKVFQFTIVPVLAPDTVAWVGVGIHIDAEMIAEIKKTLPVGIDITLIDNMEDGQLMSLITTLDGNAKNEIDTILAGTIDEGRVSFDSVADYNYMAYVQRLPSSLGTSSAGAVLTYSLDAAYSPYMTLAYILVVLAALGLFSLIAGSMTVARSVSAPLKVLARATRLIQIGRYEKVEELTQKDEIGQLANHFNQMVVGIQDREEQIIYQAEHDLETGLPNRMSLEKYLQILMNNHKDTEQEFSILQLSVGRFEDIRNTLGYEMARGLIKNIGVRLLRSSNGTNFVARLSTTDFSIVQEGANLSDAKKLARSLMEIFEEPFNVDNFTIDTSVSIGISNCPEHADNVELLIQRASIASIAAKDSIDQICVYDQKIDKYDPDQLSLMGDFRKSLEEGDVKFYYQPKIDLNSGRITHVEALVRWIHPVRGFIPPDDFITLAEQTGHIHHLTIWGLDKVISQLRQWADEGIDLKMAFNLSARDLTNRKLPEIIIKLLEKYHVPRSRMVLEVTESAIMQDPELALSVLNALEQHGLILSIDDYGTGYSSMSYLKQLPVKELKIDKSFVLNLANNREDEILVRSTIELGHNLGLKVTAEGVEDERSLELLKSFGCDTVQGFYISKPLPVADLYDFLKNSSFGQGVWSAQGIAVEEQDNNSLVRLLEHKLAKS